MLSQREPTEEDVVGLGCFESPPGAPGPAPAQQGPPKQGAQPHGQAPSLAGTKTKGIWARQGTQTPAPAVRTAPVLDFLC